MITFCQAYLRTLKIHRGKQSTIFCNCSHPVFQWPLSKNAMPILKARASVSLRGVAVRWKQDRTEATYLRISQLHLCTSG